MKHRATTLLPPLLTLCTLLACDLGPHSIGSLSSGGETDGGEDQVCGGVASADFEVIGLGPGVVDVTLTCAASVSSIASGYAIALSGCTDEQAMAHDDVQIVLEGAWSEPLVDGRPAIELRYVMIPIAIVVDGMVVNEYLGRWLQLRDADGPLPLPLLAVDAPTTHPGAYGDYAFDYAPLGIDLAESECPLIEHPACAPIQIADVVVSVEDQPFFVPEGSVGDVGVGDQHFQVIVARARELVDDCPGWANAEYHYGIVATAP